MDIVNGGSGRCFRPVPCGVDSPIASRFDIQKKIMTKTHKLISIVAASSIVLAVLFRLFMSDRQADFSASIRGVSFTAALELGDDWRVSRSTTAPRPDSVSLAEVSIGDRRVFVMVGTTDSPLLSMLRSLPLDEDVFELQTNSALFPIIEMSSRGGLLAVSTPLQSPLDSHLGLVVILSGTVVDRDRALELIHSVNFKYALE